MHKALFIIALCLALASCSTQKNTPASRWWHGFNAHYNTYYNGTLAYIDGSLAKEEGNKDNYTELLPLYTVANKGSRDLGKAQFQTAVTKAEKAIHQHSIKKRPEWNKNRRKTERDIEWLSRREYNPFLWKAWMLMGRSQFHMGAFDEAAATFSYMSRLYRTQPAIYGKARAWLVKCYTEQAWLYDAEDVIRSMSRDSIDWRARREWDNALANYYLHTADYAKAATYLRQVIAREGRAKQRAREWFLLGQILARQGREDEAYSAFRHVLRQNPPYELEFNARIAMTEVMPTAGGARKRLARLRRMARSEKNAEYLDQVYYAIGNIHLAEKDTAAAISAYERGAAKATRAGIEKGVLLLRLGDVYWQLVSFSDARRCYGEAIGLLDKDRPDYATLANRSKILDELVPHTEAVHLQDSLQELAHIDEPQRLAAIDRVIEALKKKEKAATSLPEGGEAAHGGNLTPPSGGLGGASSGKPGGASFFGGASSWYFYNPMAVGQGKQTFQRLWGKRENADDWQRQNKTVVAADTPGDDEAVTDTISGDTVSETPQDSAATDTAALDPHRREFYLAQIPFTEEQMAASNAILADALFHSGVIFKDRLDNLSLSERALTRLNKTFPEYENTAETLYHLFLLYSRKGDETRAAECRIRLAAQFPQHELTRTVCDPYFRENALYGTHREDSLYAETYLAFRDERHDLVEHNAALSADRYPLGAHRDKFLFIGGLSRLNKGDADSCLTALKRMVAEYPQSAVAPLAGMIINGVKAGRTLHGARFRLDDIWSYRARQETAEGDTTEAAFSDDRTDEYLFLLTYHPDTLGQERENKLLYEVARHNFTSYLVRNFDIVIDDFQGYHRLTVSGFRNLDEALAYSHSLAAVGRVRELARGSRSIIISRKNLELLGTRFSYNDYADFYDRHLAPRVEPDSTLLREPVIAPELYDPEERVEPTSADTPPADSGKPLPKSKTQGSTTRQVINADVLEIIDDTAPKAKPLPKKKDEKKKDEKKKEVKTDDDEYFELDGF